MFSKRTFFRQKRKRRETRRKRSKQEGRIYSIGYMEGLQVYKLLLLRYFIRVQCSANYTLNSLLESAVKKMNIFNAKSSNNKLRAAFCGFSFPVIYRVIRIDCRSFNNLSYTIHLRQEYMYFLFNRTTLQVCYIPYRRSICAPFVILQTSTR